MRRIFLMCLVLFVMTACGAHYPWVVVSQANPNPLLGQKQFAVAPVDLSSFRVGEKSEAEYLASKKDESKENWGETRNTIQGKFIEGIMQAGAKAGLQITPGESGAPFIVRAKVDWIEPGYYAVVAGKASTVRMTVKIVSADGKDVDTFIVEHSSGASLYSPSVNSRIGPDSEADGQFAARYLSVRSTGEQK